MNGRSKGPVEQTKDVGRHERDIMRYYKENVDVEVLEKVYRRYCFDFKLFGYGLDGFLRSETKVESEKCSSDDGFGEDFEW